MTYTLLSCIDSRIIEPTKFYGRFELAPFAPGQGLTVANALRRSLLSQLPGTAITLVQITGASHEYDTLVGVRECVLDILLNLKQIVLKSDFEMFTPQVGFLNVTGPGVVRARDLKLPFFIYSVDPDQYIATLTTKGQLNIKFLINCGKNYLTHTPSSIHYLKWVDFLKKAQPKAFISELDKTDDLASNSNFSNSDGQRLNLYLKWKNERQKTLKKLSISDSKNDLSYFVSTATKKPQVSQIVDPLSNNELDQTSQMLGSDNKFNNKQTTKIGYFPIDAIFAPITRVNYTIELKDDLKTKNEVIILEIWTNGTIDPRHAIHNAVKALIELFLPLQQMRINSKSLVQKDSNLLPKLLNKHDAKANIESTEVNLQAQDRYLINELSNGQSSEKKFTTNLKNLTKLKALPTIIKNSNQHNNTSDKQLQLNSQVTAKFLELDVLNLDLPSRVYLALKSVQINTIGDLVSKTKNQLLALPNFNEDLAVEIENCLIKYSLKLK